MRLDLANLPSDIDLLHRLVRDMAAAVETRDDEIGRLQRLIKQLQRTQFGRRSERLDPDQLALGIEDLDADIASAEAHHAVPSASDPEPDPRAASRRPTLPGHLPREDVRLDVETLQKFAAAHASIHNHFNHDRHLNRRDIFKQNRATALAEWRQLAA